MLFFQKKPKTAKNNSFLEPAFPLACCGISFPQQNKGNAGSESEIEPKRVHYGKLVPRTFDSSVE